MIFLAQCLTMFLPGANAVRGAVGWHQLGVCGPLSAWLQTNSPQGYPKSKVDQRLVLTEVRERVFLMQSYFFDDAKEKWKYRQDMLVKHRIVNASRKLHTYEIYVQT